jgi:hypothetical protein
MNKCIAIISVIIYLEELRQKRIEVDHLKQAKSHGKGMFVKLSVVLVRLNLL